MSQMTKRRRTPEEQARAAEEKRERQNEIARLKAQGAEVVTDPAHRIIRAERLDFASLLLRRDAISERGFNGWRRLEELHATATGALRGEQGYERVDTTTLGQNITDLQINASKNLEKLLSKIGPRDRSLICALLEPGASLVGRWHYTVSRVTGETNRDVYAAIVRGVCENLALAWTEMDYGRAA